MFRTEPLEEMVAVGHVGPARARLWLRSSRTGEHLVRWWPESEPDAGGAVSVDVPRDPARDHTAAVDVPREGTSLRPRTPYRFRVEHPESGLLVGEGRFETAPASPQDAPDRFAIALASCHQPFDAEGAVRPESEAMLRAVRRCFEEQGVRALLLVGDQMYTDYPAELSLFDAEHFASVAPPGRRRVQDCTADEVRRLLHERYRRFWNVPQWKALHAELPVYPMLDDHEIADNWGSRPEHRTPPWRAFGEGALAAYRDYQFARVEPASVSPKTCCDLSFDYGPLAVYALDIRSNRRPEPGARLFTPDQLASLDAFLERERDRDVIGLVLSVPAVHLPKAAAHLMHKLRRVPEDFADRWSTAGHVDDRDRLLARLHRQQRERPQQRIVLLSGDIHIACAHEITWRDGTGSFLQLVSSGITNIQSPLIRYASACSILMNRSLHARTQGLSARVRRLRGVGGHGHNPYTHLNVALLGLRRRDDGRWDVEPSIWGQRDGEPICVFRSPPIAPPALGRRRVQRSSLGGSCA